MKQNKKEKEKENERNLHGSNACNINVMLRNNLDSTINHCTSIDKTVQSKRQSRDIGKDGRLCLLFREETFQRAKEMHRSKV